MLRFLLLHHKFTKTFEKQSKWFISSPNYLHSDLFHTVFRKHQKFSKIAKSKGFKIYLAENNQMHEAISQRSIAMPEGIFSTADNSIFPFSRFVLVVVSLVVSHRKCDTSSWDISSQIVAYEPELVLRWRWWC